MFLQTMLMSSVLGAKAEAAVGFIEYTTSTGHKVSRAGLQFVRESVA